MTKKRREKSYRDFMEYIRRAPNCERLGYKGQVEKLVCYACEWTGRRVSGILCKGRGYIIKNLCPTCGGRGRVAKKARVKVSMGSSKASLRIP